jgi:Protein of unknown function (DUF1641)
MATMAQPEVPAGLESALRDIPSRLAAIEQRLTEVSATVPKLVAMAGDVVDEQAAKLGDVDERVREALSLLERVSRPSTLRALSAAVELLEQAPNTVAILGDSLEEALTASASHGEHLDELLYGLLETAKRGLKLLGSREFRALLDSPMLDYRMLETLGNVSHAVVETTRHGVEPVGVFGALQAMGKEPVRKALGFALGVASRLGATLDNTRSLPALPATETRGELP